MRRIWSLGLSSLCCPPMWDVPDIGPPLCWAWLLSPRESLPCALPPLGVCSCSLPGWWPPCPCALCSHPWGLRASIFGSYPGLSSISDLTSSSAVGLWGPGLSGVCSINMDKSTFPYLSPGLRLPLSFCVKVIYTGFIGEEGLASTAFVDWHQLGLIFFLGAQFPASIPATPGRGCDWGPPHVPDSAATGWGKPEVSCLTPTPSHS